MMRSGAILRPLGNIPWMSFVIGLGKQAIYPGQMTLQVPGAQQRKMQAMDHQLARQLMGLRAQIHQLKVEQACHHHKEMLDDVTFELEGSEEDLDLLCNISPKMAFLLSTPLKHIGVTRMNINSRHFSLC
ncbi:protein FAM167A-like isoform X1 [Crotalus tigris]|uniref:protein FAM167A-like isoform X1 n=1 Tax=Crotalus tigris TaxID=88082 RepID=UPI00192F5FE0|nr:protein FAM167A-like isoform X1 [Crotalus tigris]